MIKTVAIKGMTCNHCVMHVKEAIESVPGVKKASVSLEKNEATVEGENWDDQALRAAVEDAGYSVA